MFDDTLRGALLERCATVLAAEPQALVDTFAAWVKKEWVSKGRSRKVDGGEQVIKFPRESPFQLCLQGASAVGGTSARRRDEIVTRAVASCESNPQLVAIAARLFAADKPKLELTPPAQVRKGQLAAWQTGIVEDAVPAIATAIAAGTGGRAALCDVCNATTSSERAIAVTAGEFREIVARGFEMDEGAIRLAQAYGASREQAIERWKRDLVAQSPTGWLLCPMCAVRAERYRVRA